MPGRINRQITRAARIGHRHVEDDRLSPGRGHAIGAIGPSNLNRDRMVGRDLGGGRLSDGIWTRARVDDAIRNERVERAIGNGIDRLRRDIAFQVEDHIGVAESVEGADPAAIADLNLDEVGNGRAG